jgi:hypothetical protein
VKLVSRISFPQLQLNSVGLPSMNVPACDRLVWLSVLRTGRQRKTKISPDSVPTTGMERSHYGNASVPHTGMSKGSNSMEGNSRKETHLSACGAVGAAGQSVPLSAVRSGVVAMDE